MEVVKKGLLYNFFFCKSFRFFVNGVFGGLFLLRLREGEEVASVIDWGWFSSRRWYCGGLW